MSTRGSPIFSTGSGSTARARYLAGEIELTDAQIDEMLAVAEEMHHLLVATSPRRAAVST